MTIEEKLLNYKEELTELKSKVDREIGSLDVTYKRLAEKLNIKGKSKKATAIKTEKAAKEKIKELNNDYEQFNKEVKELVTEIESDLKQYEEE